MRAGLRHIPGAECTDWHLGKKSSLSLQLRAKGEVARGAGGQSGSGLSWGSWTVQAPHSALGLPQRRGTNSRTMNSPVHRAPGACPPKQTPLGAAGKAWAAFPSLPAGISGISACRECISTAGLVSAPCWDLVVQNGRDCTCKVLAGDSARVFHTRIIAQTAHLDSIHLIFNNTNCLGGLLPALGEVKRRQMAELWWCCSPSLAQAIPLGSFH